jgi:hypothetical protein
MPSQNSKSSLPKYVATCKFCKSQAFQFAPGKKPPDELLGSIIYYRGFHPVQVVQEMIDKEAVKCATCRETMRSEEDYTITVEIFSVKSLLRMVETVEKYNLAAQTIAEAHLGLLEYANILSIPFEGWQQRQALYDRDSSDSLGVLKRISTLCVGLGQCGDQPREPSKIIKASNADLQRLKEQNRRS